jgi:hypothetical protein
MGSPKSQYLLAYRRDVASQFGEDGIIEKIFSIISERDPTRGRWAVEFGAWDGQFCSNTLNLIKNHGWSAVLIEANRKKFAELTTFHASRTNVHCLNRFVNLGGRDTLDNILSETPIPQTFDLLSIDIDGADYHVWKSLDRYRPGVVVIEFNPCIPKDIEFIQVPDMTVQHGTSILAMTKLAKRKGYELVCINQENAFFVDRKYFSLFGIEDNSVDALIHFEEPLRVFELYDGTLVFQGTLGLYWYGLGFNARRLQMIPEFFRKRNIVWSHNKIHKVLFLVYRVLAGIRLNPRVFDWKHLSYRETSETPAEPPRQETRYEA